MLKKLGVVLGVLLHAVSGFAPTIRTRQLPSSHPMAASHPVNAPFSATELDATVATLRTLVGNAAGGAALDWGGLRELLAERAHLSHTS